ncbi:hypothetical protein BMS3Bbin16_00430 [archaeon BMS3Bbin16]|nr:hypothetical protein BMS3Bbin16_00430 [archaeon BMS3Bbin16]
MPFIGKTGAKINFIVGCIGSNYMTAVSPFDDIQEIVNYMKNLVNNSYNQLLDYTEHPNTCRMWVLGLLEHSAEGRVRVSFALKGKGI